MNGKNENTVNLTKETRRSRIT